MDDDELGQPDLPEAPPVDHRPDGLDLARQVTAAAAGSTPPARRRTRKKERRSTERGASDDRDPRLLDGEVARMIAERGWQLPLRMRGVFARWGEIVGADIAEHATPESFTEGRLVVRCDSTAWATQLKLLAPTVVRRLNEELGDGTVTVIDVLGPHGPTWKKGPRSVRDGRGPRDTYG